MRLGPDAVLPLSLPRGRIAVPPPLTRPPLFMYGNGNPSCPLPVCLLRGPRQSTYSPTLPRHLHVINLPPAERGRAGWQTTRKAIFISGLQPPNCRLAFIQFSPALSHFCVPEFGRETGMRKLALFQCAVRVGFQSQVHIMNGFT